MKLLLTIGAILLAAMGGSTALHAAPNIRDVRSALYCLTHGSNPLLSRARGDRYAVIYSRDIVTFPGEHDLLVFVKVKGGSYDGFVVVVAGRLFDVVNNATMRAGRAGVIYVNDPLGGVWTHDYIAAHFLRALKRRPVMIASDRPPLPRPTCRQLG